MNKAAFYASLRKASSGVFGSSLSQGQVEGMEGILTAFALYGDGNTDTLAYALATAYHETARRMLPVREGLASTDAGARRAVNNLAAKRGPKSAVARYAKPTGPYGHVYYGRGHVQLTWLENYKTTGDKIGVDLVKEPDRMLEPVLSARVLIEGLLDGRWNGAGKGLRYYLDAGDVKGARRTVNGTDKAAQIEGYYQSFLTALVEADYKPSPPFIAEIAEPPAPKPEPVAVPKPEKETTMLEGKKTYITAFMIAAIAIVEGLLGIDIPGAEMSGDWINYILGAFGLGALRAGVAKAE